jgi:polyprenyl-phospho-N-acetylgalactosaminyl synthase
MTSAGRREWPARPHLNAMSDASVNSSRAGVWVIVPAYNEGPRLSATLTALCPLWPNVVLIDDGSLDDTRAVASRYPVWVLRHIVNRGAGAALQTGIDFALGCGAEILVTFDSDGQHDAEEIGRMVEPVRDGRADVALGSRFLGGAVGMPAGRRLVLRLGILFTRAFSRLRVSDTHNGLRAFSRNAARLLHLTHDRMAHASEILDRIHQHGLRYVEVPVTVRYSAETLAKGQSSWNAVRIVGELLLGRLIR